MSMKASIHFTDEEWKAFQAKLEAERKKTGYKISVNKYLRKIVIEGTKEALNGRR